LSERIILEHYIQAALRAITVPDQHFFTTGERFWVIVQLL
jgi:hypothetical protein